MNYGRYQTVAELGRGSMGVVYKAHDPQIDRMIALKVLREDRVTSEDFVRRFLKEAMAVGRLSHPGIVTVYDVGQDRDSIYIAMEFLHGTPLNELMATKRFTFEEIVDIGIQATQALHYAHQNGIVHRDIKPPNIIYSPEGSIQITDFGVARIEDPNGQQMTQAGEILGTPRYMSPEQAMGQALDGRSDLYSLGVILYQLTTGKHPFQGDTLVAIFRAIVQDIPEPPHTVDPKVPETLSNVIMKLLDKDPSNRFVSGQDLIDELRNCLSLKTADDTPPPFTPAEEKSGISKVFIAGLIVILLGGLGGYYFLQHINRAESTDKTLLEKNSQPPTVNISKNDTPVPIKPAIPVADDLNELIHQGIALSVSITDLPKKELVLKSARELVKISPRYQEDVKLAESTYNNVHNNLEKQLDLYFKELSSWSDAHTKDQIAQAFDKTRQEYVSERQRRVLDLSEEHLRSLQNGDKLTPEIVLDNFSKHFNNFVD
jgi:eukaryotic-like serine/threonine-protein kinase